MTKKVHIQDRCNIICTIRRKYVLSLFVYIFQMSPHYVACCDIFNMFKQFRLFFNILRENQKNRMVYIFLYFFKKFSTQIRELPFSWFIDVLGPSRTFSDLFRISLGPLSDLSRTFSDLSRISLGSLSDLSRWYLGVPLCFE